MEEYLLVDGYNIIFSWEELRRLSQSSMDRARQALMNDLCEYQAHKKCHVILVFDAYRVKGGVRRMEQYHNIHVVYTREAETADSYIEQASYKLGKRCRVRVANWSRSLFWDMAVCVSLPAPLRRRCGWSRRTSAG